MKFFAILSLLSIGALAAAVAVPDAYAEALAEPEAYADANAAADFLLEKRVNCKSIKPLCASGTFIKKTACQCPGQKARCDLWACPRGRRQVCGQKGSGCVFVE